MSPKAYGDWRADVLKFWFGLEPKQWWNGGPDLDQLVREKFLSLSARNASTGS